MTVLNCTPATLAAALRAATGGDVLELADGEYGPRAIRTVHPWPITLVGGPGARFGLVTLDKADGVTLRGMTLTAGLSAKGARNITVGVCAVAAPDTGTALYFLNCAGVTVAGCTVDAGRFGLLVNSVQGFTIRGNTIRKAGEDVLRVTGDSFDGLIEGNNLLDTSAGPTTHPDFIQFFGNNGKAPHDIVIRGNHIWEDPATGRVSGQGIFLTDSRSKAGYRNLLIEDNLICVGSPNTIMVVGAMSNVTIRNNALMPTALDGGGVIRLGTRPGLGNDGLTICNNVFKMFYGPLTGASIGENHIYGRGANRAELFSGDGSKRAHFLPPVGSHVGRQFGARQ